MEQMDKAEIGKRIRLLRKELDLRQWQLAEKLESTQPAIHKYENGIIPEVRRLLHLARIGNTTVEWILTGRQWEDGSRRRERYSSEVCELAEQFQQFGHEKRRALESSLQILESAMQALEHPRTSKEDYLFEEVAQHLATCNRQTLATLRTAIRIHAAVADGLAAAKVKELESAGFLSEETQAV